MKTINKLHWLRTEKKDLTERIFKLEEKIKELSNLGCADNSDMPKGGTPGNPTEKYVCKLIELKEKRQNLILKCIEIESETEEFINDVNDSEIRTLLRKYYIDGKSWEEIAKQLYPANSDGSTPRKKVNNYLRRIK